MEMGFHIFVAFLASQVRARMFSDGKFEDICPLRLTVCCVLLLFWMAQSTDMHTVAVVPSGSRFL